MANAVTHGVGALLALLGTVWLLVAARHGSALSFACCAIFATTLLLVYLCSTLYHALVLTRARRFFQVLDHAAIHLLIAGTYTPFTLLSLGGRLGWTIFAIVWALAAAGILFQCLAARALDHPLIGRITTLIYLFQGWMIVFALRALYEAIGAHAMLWLIAGGLAYTFGVFFFVLDRLRYFHATWHLFVLAGSFAHYCAILFYVVPQQ